MYHQPWFATMEVLTPSGSYHCTAGFWMYWFGFGFHLICVWGAAHSYRAHLEMTMSRWVKQHCNPMNPNPAALDIKCFHLVAGRTIKQNGFIMGACLQHAGLVGVDLHGHNAASKKIEQTRLKTGWRAHAAVPPKSQPAVGSTLCPACKRWGRIAGLPLSLGRPPLAGI